MIRRVPEDALLSPRSWMSKAGVRMTGTKDGRYPIRSMTTAD